MPIEAQIEEVHRVRNAGQTIIGASIGVNEEGRTRAEALVREGVNCLTIDIAHGHSIAMIEQLQWLRSKFSDRVELIAGNVATPKPPKS